VIVIIAILVALLFPAIKTTILKAEVNQAKADTKNIENAVQSFRNEYGRLPTKDQGVTDQVYDSSNAFNIYNILRATTTTWAGTDYNPRKIVFLETPSRKGAFDSNGNFLDPWGSTYVLILDCNYDGTISGLASPWNFYNNQAGPVLVISFGPDRASGNSTNRADDVVNYN
jgi:type II secretory pathway pseudopilin PulG